MRRYSGTSILVLAHILLILLCFLPAVSAAQAAEPVKPDPLILAFNGYKLTAYDVQVKVHDNNVLEVTENITAYFDQPKHGIYRNIPIKNKLRWFINQETIAHTQKAKITNISVTDGKNNQPLPMEQEANSNQLRLKIGDAGQMVTGEQSYVIRYHYVLGSDVLPQFDELYYNLIGDGWDTYIGNISFSVEMPKAFDASKIRFMFDTEDAGSEVSYTVEGNRISGTVNKVLPSGHRLSIRLELPQGYFRNVEDAAAIIRSGLAVDFMLVSVLLFLFFGRNPRLQQYDTNASLPEFTSAEAGYILGGDAQKRGRIALLLYWAEKGYLVVETDEFGRMFLIKQKAADDGMKPYEQTLFKALFISGESVSTETLRAQCIGVMAKVANAIRDYFAEPARRLYTVASGRARNLCYLLALVSLVLVVSKMFGDAYSLTDRLTIAASTLGLSCLVFPPIGFLSYYARKNGTGSISGQLTNLICLLLVMGMLLGLLVYADALDNESSLSVLAVGVCGIAGAFTRRRTEFGNRLLSQVIALKQQMEKGQQNRYQPSSYFYSLLAYAYVFNMSEIWAKTFDGLELEAPHWFRGRFINLYSTLYFSNWANEELAALESNMTDNDSSGDGGSNGGGGGSGGGGGGTW